MSIHDIKESREMKECFEKIGGRQGISNRAIQICEQVAKSKSEREAVFAIGRMARLIQVCKADHYWDEKSSLGKELEFYAVRQAADNNGDFSKAIDASGDDKR